MARYIDAEKLCKSLRDMAFYQNPYKQSTILGVVSSIENFPTADVAPKSEVERLERLRAELSKEVDRLTAELEEKSKRLREVLPIVAELKAEVAREIFEEIFKTMTSIYSRVQRDCFGRHGDDPHTIMLVGKVEGIKYIGDEIAELKKKYTGEQT